MTPRLVTVSWTTETGHATREHYLQAMKDEPRWTMCWKALTPKAIRRTDAPITDICLHCLRKLKKGAEAMEASK